MNTKKTVPLSDDQTLKRMYERKGETVRRMARKIGCSEGTIRKRLRQAGVTFKSIEQRTQERVYPRAVLPLDEESAKAAGNDVSISMTARIAVPFIVLPQRQWNYRDLMQCTGLHRSTVKKHLEPLIQEGSMTVIHDGIDPIGRFRNPRFKITTDGINKLSPCVRHAANREYRIQVNVIRRQVDAKFRSPQERRKPQEE